MQYETSVTSDIGAAAAGDGAAPLGLKGALGKVPGAVWLQLGIFAFNKFAESRARSKAKRDARDSTAVKIKNVQAVEANETVKILYGTAATKGHRYFIHVQSGEQVPLPPTQERTNMGLGRLPFDQSQKRFTPAPGYVRSHPTEFYLAQYVLSQGQIGTLLGLTADGRDVRKPWTENGLSGSHGGTLAGCWQVPLGTASTWANTFAGAKRDATATFTGLSYVDFWAQMPDSNNGKYRVFRGRTPEPVFIVQGRFTRDITATGPSLLSTLAGRDNAARVLADYLTNDQYGPNLSDDQIDWPSFHRFRDHCEQSLLDEATAPGTIVTTESLAPVDCVERERRRDPGERVSVPAATYIQRCVEGLGYGDSGTVPGATIPLKRSLGKVRWGAYNGEVDSSLTFQDAVEQIIQPCPGVVVGELDGKVSVSFVPWSTTTNTGTLTDAELEGLVNVTDPDPESAYNKYVVTFNDIDKNYHENSAVWTDADLVAEDDGLIQEYEERVAGVCTSTQALTLARSRCLESRRRRFTGRYNIFAAGGIYLPNAVVQITSADSGITEQVRITDYVVQNQAVCAFNAIEHEPFDYGPVLAAKFTEFDQAEEPTPTGAYVRLTGVPSMDLNTNTTVKLAAEVVGTTQTVDSWAWSVGTSTNATTDWIPTGTANTITVTATIGDCELTATAEVTVQPSADMRVEIVPRRGRRYHAYVNGTLLPSWTWSITPPTAAGTLDSTTASDVRITGGSADVRAELRVQAGTAVDELFTTDKTSYIRGAERVL